MKECKNSEWSYVRVNFIVKEAICKCKYCGRTFKLEGLSFTEPKTEDSVTVEFKMVKK